MNLAGATFRAVSNSSNGSLNSETQMTFHTDGDVVVGTYSGGTIAIGHVLAKRIGEHELEMLYQGATTSGDVQAGKARAHFEENAKGPIRMLLDWQWLTGDRSSGQSDWVRVKPSSQGISEV